MPVHNRLDIPRILHELGDAGIRYVLTGSVAAAAYCVPVEPRDLDIAPALDPDNVAALASLLEGWAAKPLYDPDWPHMSREDCERWTPYPATIEQLDHLFVTRHGLFDVVPARSGSYPELAARAVPAAFESWKIPVAHPEDLIAHLRPLKPKHQERRPALAALGRRGELEPILPPPGVTG